MKKILITGNAGLLGSNLVDYISKNDKEAEIYGIDDLSGGYIENINPNINFIQLDILDNQFDQIFAQINPDYVFHFAAYAAEALSPFIRSYNYSNNLLATTKVVNNCIRYNIKRLVFTSSIAVYGNAPAPFRENAQPSPMDPYGVAKYACEMDIKIAGEQHGLDWCILRPHNVYGPKQNIWDCYRNVFGIWMYQYLNNGSLSIYGDGEQKRAFTYIDDIVSGLYESAFSKKCSKEIINLGGIHQYSINQAADLLIDIMGGGSKVFLETRHESKYAFTASDKSVALLNFEHKTNLKDGLSKMWDWAIMQPARQRFVWPKYELDNKIYGFWKQASL